MQKSSNFIVYGLLFLMLLVFSSSSCGDQIVIPTKNDFTKADRETLGTILLHKIQANTDSFPILPEIGRDTIPYNFIQTLYNQVTNIAHLDLHAPANNRWDKDREWKIFILDFPNEKIVFTLPGGFLFISTGFLLSMERENELYYLLAFEASLMNDFYLFDRLINEYNTVNLQSIIDGSSATNGITPRQMALDLSHFIFDPFTTSELDELAVEMICETSLYHPDGIIDIINDISPIESKWLKMRETYSGRESVISDLVSENGDCGDLRTNGVYQEQVLDILE